MVQIYFFVLDRDAISVRRRDADGDMHERALANASAVGAEHAAQRRYICQRGQPPPRLITLGLHPNCVGEATLRYPPFGIHREAMAFNGEADQSRPAVHTGAGSDGLRERGVAAIPRVREPSAGLELRTHTMARQHKPQLVEFVVRDDELIPEFIYCSADHASDRSSLSSVTHSTLSSQKTCYSQTAWR